MMQNWPHCEKTASFDGVGNKTASVTTEVRSPGLHKANDWQQNSRSPLIDPIILRKQAFASKRPQCGVAYESGGLPQVIAKIVAPRLTLHACRARPSLALVAAQGRGAINR